MTNNSPEFCPHCDIELDAQGRCRACWGDAIGACKKCDELLNSDGTCPTGCTAPYEEEEDEPIVRSGLLLNFGLPRLVQITVHDWPSGPKAMYFGQSLAKALGVSPTEMKLVDTGMPRIFQAKTSSTKEYFRKRLRELYQNKAPKIEFQFLE